MNNRLPRVARKRLSDESLQPSKAFKDRLLNTLLEEHTMAKSKKSNQSLFNGLKARNIVPISALVVVLVAVGTTSALVGKDQAERAHAQKTALPTSLTGLLSIDAIKVIALKDASAGTTLDGIQLETEDSIVLYKVRYSDGSFKLYNAKSGTLIIKTTDNPSAPEKSESVPVGFVAGITIDQARVIAQGKFADKTITKIELETENSIVVYSVRFVDGSRVDVNANDGAIISVRSGAEQTRSESIEKSESEKPGDDNTSNKSSDDQKSGSDSGETETSGSHKGQ